MLDIRILCVIISNLRSKYEIKFVENSLVCSTEQLLQYISELF